jgi:transcriptional regulator GlxA family with amidase domain
MHEIVVLALPRVVAFDLAIPAQVFGHADEINRYDFSVCAERPGLVPTTTGFSIEAARGLDAIGRADTVVVPGFTPDAPLSTDILNALRDAHRRGARVVSVCTGAFALAAAGLLDGKRATTHWRNARALQVAYPAVSVDADVLYIEEANVATSAGIAAGIDLCLQLVRRDFGEATATSIARRMVVPPHREGGQAQFIERPMPETATFAQMCSWAAANLDRDLNVPLLARRAGWAPRSFSRRFLAEVGVTPLRWLTAQRLALARELLESTDLTIEDIAVRCGLGSAANLRTHFHRDTATTPSRYRRTFSGGAAIQQRSSQDS